MRTLEESLAIMEDSAVRASVRASVSAVQFPSSQVGTTGEGTANGEYDSGGTFYRYMVAGDVVGVYGVKR